MRIKRSMKILFLDVDGVLNSAMYEPIKQQTEFQFIDESRLTLLKEIISRTKAEIVLTSTWRDCWNVDYDKCDSDGKYLTNILKKYGLHIYDTTAYSEQYYMRPKEITKWLAETNDYIDSYAILDDDSFEWGFHKNRVIRTFPSTTRGLEPNIAEQTIKILNNEF